MRILTLSSPRILRAAVVASVGLLVAACSGGSGTIPNSGSNQLCNPNAGAITLARPTPGYPMNGNNIEIVDSTNQDQLNQFTSQFDLIVVDQFNNQLVTSGLSAVPDVNGPHPYTNDFFYQGALQGNLLAGRNYNVYLNAPNTNCTPGLVGSFST